LGLTAPRVAKTPTLLLKELVMHHDHKETKLVDGVLYPSLADVRKAVDRIQKEIKSHSKFSDELKANPRAVLGAFGISEDVQNELLSDMALETHEDCYITCTTTCWFTRCVITTIHIS
jgi:hypothetical protein